MSVDAINLALDELMDEAANLDAAELRQIRAAWDEGSDAERRAAWATVKDALKRTGREGLMDETRERVRAWFSDVAAMLGVYNVQGVTDVRYQDMGPAKAAAAPAVLDAAAVAIVGDFLSEDERNLLESPFWGDEDDGPRP